jgi:hypothetical protein
MGNPFQRAKQRLGTDERSLRAVCLDHYDPLADPLLSPAAIDNPFQKTNAVGWHR